LLASYFNNIIEEIDSHPSGGGGDAISNSVAVLSRLDESVKRLVQTVSGDRDFDENVLLEEGIKIACFLTHFVSL
jgi:hypothetical protein